ncbi:MAG: DNA-directed RNA polymerase subunit P [Candidatus Aenigmarchaeota archaeon]|nr:DNA-directed RNA polymerase subunit P [Candidatus Aenigmarchaeota archaeon]
MYKCVKCKKIVQKLDEKTRCPYCGYRIFVKLRAETSNKVLAR